MSIARNAAVILAILLVGLALFQLALALGAPWGRAAFGGFVERPGTALRVSAGVATLVWTGAALVVLRRAGLPVWAPLPDSWLPVVIWILVGILVVAIVVNAISPSLLEKSIWVPFGVVAATLATIVALGSPAAKVL
jgi:hypothetical protein